MSFYKVIRNGEVELQEFANSAALEKYQKDFPGYSSIKKISDKEAGLLKKMLKEESAVKLARRLTESTRELNEF